MARTKGQTKGSNGRRTRGQAKRGRPVREGGLQVLSANIVPHAHEEGPRGFNFGEKWKQSIKEQRGIALYPSNLPKLMKTAEAYLPASRLQRVRSQAELVKVLSRVID